ncbi:MAG: hypothetical protein IKQ60_01745 [Candidatus Methanomethylophilaceae archaeon]|nr:hypothetical protein [Candidatus Methanomethylophilaceae archaeon]
MDASERRGPTPRGLACDDPDYVRGFELLDGKDVDGAFEEWRKCLQDADYDRAWMLYRDIPRAYCDHVVANLEWEYFPVPEDPVALSRDMSARLGPDKNLVQDLISGLANRPIGVGEHLFKAWDVAECLSNAYVTRCAGLEELEEHIGWMAGIEDTFERELASLGEEEYAASARARASFCREAASRIRKISVRDCGEHDAFRLEILYVEAKEAYEKAFRSRVMGERRKRGSREALEDFLEEFTGEPLS